MSTNVTPEQLLREKLRKIEALFGGVPRPMENGLPPWGCSRPHSCPPGRGGGQGNCH